MKKTLIVIDAQKYFLTEKTKPVIKKIQKYIFGNLISYDKIYFTIFKNDSSSSLWRISDWKGCSKSPDTDICDELKKFTNKNNLFNKNFLSAIKIPQIQKGLKENKTEEVHLCGFDTDCCVLATAYDLFDQGIKPVVLEDLTFSTSKDKLHAPAIKMLKRNIGFVKNS